MHLLLLLACAARSPVPAEVTVTRSVAVHDDADPATTGVTAPALREILAEHWALTLAASPVWATQLGVHDHDAKLPDLSPTAQARWRGNRNRLLTTAQAIDVDGLSPADALTRDLFIDKLLTERGNDVCDYETWNLGARNNVITKVAWIPQAHPVRNPQDAHNLLARIRAVPVLIAQDMANKRAGVAAGRVADAESLRRTVAFADEELGRPLDEWPLLDTLDDEALPADLGNFAAELQATVDGPVRAAMTSWRDMVRDELLPAARPDDAPGLASMRDGAACYQAAIAEHTGLSLSPEAIHQIGLDELTRIHAGFEQVGGRVFGTSELDVVLGRLRDDPELRFETPEQIVAEAEAALAAAQLLAPDWFGLLPQAPCIVSQVPAHEAPWTYVAYYQPPFPDGRKPGEYTVNTYAPETRLRHEARVLAVHESVPGHHLQVALTQELPETPAFRRHRGLTVFVEGWALYGEVLADEMGLYRDDTDRLGALSFDAWRASRLVVDTGIHHLGWSRQQAVAFMRENTPLAHNNIDNEVDRYIGWPGQALGYKLGQLEILRLRALAQESLGDRFDIAAFHDVVLGAGPVPMVVLEARVRAWIAAHQG